MGRTAAGVLFAAAMVVVIVGVDVLVFRGLVWQRMAVAVRHSRPHTVSG